MRSEGNPERAEARVEVAVKWSRTFGDGRPTDWVDDQGGQNDPQGCTDIQSLVMGDLNDPDKHVRRVPY